MSNSSRQGSAFDRTIAAWAKEWRKEHITPEIKRLIRLASWDLHFGPIPANVDSDDDDFAGFPGFEKACEQINDAVSDLPRDLYIDADGEYWFIGEPSSFEECYNCEGRCEVPAGAEEFTDKCGICNGSGVVDTFLESIYKVEYKDLLAAIVGKELAQYI